MKWIINLALLLVLSYWAIKPLLSPGFFPVHDATQIERIYEMGQALKEGQFPVRIVKDLGYGYGYPLFNFYAPLPYYFGGSLTLFGVDEITATKIMFLTGILLSGILMFFLCKEFWGSLAGLLGGLLFIYAPYHAVDIYVRGAVGEFWALAFLPLLILGLFQLSQKKYSWLVPTGLAFTFIILSHNITGMITAGFYLLFIFYEYFWHRNLKNSLYLISSLFLALGLSAFFWLPAVFEASFTNVSSQFGGGADFHKHFIFLDQLWDSPWGYGGSAGRLSGLSYKIGKLHILAFIVSLILIFQKRFVEKEKAKFSLFLILITIFSIFMCLPSSVSIWELFSPLSYIQYPWRFLIFIITFISFLGSGVLNFPLKTIFKLPIFILIVFLLLIYNIKYFNPQYVFALNVSQVRTWENLRWKVSKISDEYLPKNFVKPQNINEIPQSPVTPLTGDPQITSLIDKANFISFNINSKKGSSLLINKAYFPGWTVFVDKKPSSQTQKNKLQLITVTVPPGEHAVEVVFKNTPIRTIGNALSIISVLFIILLFSLKSLKKLK